MNEFLTLSPMFAAGLLLGTIFFGGLWWTVQKGILSQHPALWFFSSLIIRTTITLAGFYFISNHHWERLLLCLLGFVVARFLFMWLTKRKQSPIPKEVSNAP